MHNSIKFSIPKEAVKATEMALIESTLPEGYCLSGRAGGGFVIRLKSNKDIIIGTVRLFGGRYEYELHRNNYGEWFDRKMKEKYPEYDDDKIVWAVFYQWLNAWSIVEMPTTDKDYVANSLVKKLPDFCIERNPVLFSFRSGDFDGKSVLLTVSSRKILPNRTVSEYDEGPKLIEITNLEVASVSPVVNESQYELKDLDLLD